MKDELSGMGRSELITALKAAREEIKGYQRVMVEECNEEFDVVAKLKAELKAAREEAAKWERCAEDATRREWRDAAESQEVIHDFSARLEAAHEKIRCLRVLLGRVRFKQSIEDEEWEAISIEPVEWQVPKCSCCDGTGQLHIENKFGEGRTVSCPKCKGGGE